MTFSTLGRLALTFGMVASATVADAAETITYKYDAKGRLIEVKRTGTVNNNVTTTYSHDKADNRKNVTTTGSPNAPPP
jgi:coenzyme F420-reducing hydrogenase delta subunit